MLICFVLLNYLAVFDLCFCIDTTLQSGMAYNKFRLFEMIPEIFPINYGLWPRSELSLTAVLHLKSRV